MLCPRCDSLLVAQRNATNPLDRLLSLFSIHPFECQLCKHRFRAKHLGDRDAATSKERRKFYRSPVQIPVDYEYSEGSFKGTITDISKGGCALDSKRQLSPGLFLRIHFPAGTAGPQHAAEQQIVTVRSAQGERAGLRFLVFTSEERQQLDETVTNTIKKFAKT